MKFTHSEENYLKTIFHLQLQHATVTTSLLAEKLQTRPASITDMLKKLNSKKLLHYKPYYGFYLSAAGKKAALTIIRRHRLWEFFLAEKLGFGWDEVHILAEELEHVGSAPLIDKLDAYLGHPRFDPHGDPIPDSNGKIKEQEQQRLTDLDVNQPGQVTKVGLQSKEMLDELAYRKIKIGTRVEIKKRSAYDQSLDLKVANQQITISEQVARYLFVKKI